MIYVRELLPLLIFLFRILKNVLIWWKVSAKPRAKVSVNRSHTYSVFLSKSLQDKGFIRKISGLNSLMIDIITFVGEIGHL